MDTGSRHQSLILFRRVVVNAGMQTVMVVKADVGLERRFKLRECRERPAADPLGLHRVEERLHMGVVLAAPGAVHAGADPVLREERAVAIRRVLDPAVGMKEARGCGSPAGSRAW